MAESSSFSRAAVGVTLALAGGQAVHWFLTPMNHPDASLLLTIAVGIQAVAGFGGAVWVATRPHSASSPR